jgi:hypothetical protein
MAQESKDLMPLYCNRLNSVFELPGWGGVGVEPPVVCLTPPPQNDTLGGQFQPPAVVNDAESPVCNDNDNDNEACRCQPPTYFLTIRPNPDLTNTMNVEVLGLPSLLCTSHIRSMDTGTECADRTRLNSK